MRRPLAAGLAAALLAGLGAATGPPVAGAPRSKVTTAAASVPCVTVRRIRTWPDARLAMQTLAVPVQEASVTAAAGEVRAGAGGILLFGSSAPSNLASALAGLERHDVPGNLGLLVMTDEEGGGVQRMANLVGSLPWAKWMGSHWTAAEIERHVAAVGRKMASNGVNVDLAPVVDVDGRSVVPGPSDPDGLRSFSGTTSVVSRDGVAYMRGLLSAGVIPVLKHFPGLGGASGNTDDGPAHTLSWSKLKKVGLPPFTTAIGQGAPAVMVSNATVPGLASYPASLSPAAIGRELVRTLGFKGLVMTDSLSAGAISAAGFSVPSAAVQALRAGADMVLFGKGTMTARQIAALTTKIESAIVSATTHGLLARWRLAAAATAVLAARHRVCSI